MDGSNSSSLTEAAVKALELAGVIYCTFENVQGSLIDCQYPDGYISLENFKQIAHAVIPRADLTDQTITISEFGHLIIGFPQRIEGTQYSRNTLLFNLCFIIRPRESQWPHYDLTGQDFPLDFGSIHNGLQPALQSAYELTVRKINRYLAYMEEENSVLSSDTLKTEVKSNNETLIHRFLRQIFTDLREQGLCVTGLDDDLPPLYLIFAPRAVNNSVSSCFTPTEDELPSGVRGDECNTEMLIGGTDIWSRVPSALEDSTATVTDSTVFVRVRPMLSSLNNLVVYVLEENVDVIGGESPFWEARDLVSSRLLPLVNGQRTVAQVASLACVDRNIARLCLTQLAQLGVVRLVSAPIFLSNGKSSEASEMFSVSGYVGLPKLLRLTIDEKLRDACFESVLSPQTKSRRLHLLYPNELILAILQVYSKLCGSSYLNLAFLLASTKSFAELLLPHSFSPSPPVSQESRNSYLPSINLLRLIQFGEVNSLIHRLHCYPVSEGVSSETQVDETRLWNLLRDQAMDGVQSVDELVYEASAKAIKFSSTNFSSSGLAAPPRIKCSLQDQQQQIDLTSSTSLPEAVVAFTARLLKEKEMRQSDRGTVLAEINMEKGKRSSLSSNNGKSDVLRRNGNDIHLLWH